MVLVAAAGCTGPVRSYGVYASKAAATAGAACSAVETAQLAVQEAVDGKLFGRSLAQTLAEAASDAADVQATFDAIQPRDGRADTLRGQLDGLLVRAVSALDDLRTAARRGDLSRPAACTRAAGQGRRSSGSSPRTSPARATVPRSARSPSSRRQDRHAYHCPEHISTGGRSSLILPARPIL